MEGGGGSHYCFKHALSLIVFQHHGRRKSQHANAPIRQPGVAAFVMPHLIRVIMPRTVDFDGQPMRWEVEIQDVGTDGVLPTESQTLQPSGAKVAPQNDLRQCH